MSRKPLILIITDYYLPGYESGGALRTLVNLVERLGDRFDFRIITRDHDGKLRREPYATVKINDWNRVGNADVYYVSKDQLKARNFKRWINEIAPDAVYLNSFFTPLSFFVLILRRLGQIGSIPIVLAPEGEFSPGALALKRVKKQPYLTLAKSLRLLEDIVWKAAAESELQDIKREIPSAGDIFIAPNMPPKIIFDAYDQSEKPHKIEGRATMVFLSRFTRKKNFNWLIEHLHGVKGELTIDIFGTLQEADYWEKCRRLIEKLPPNIKIEAKGPVPHEQVSATLAKYQFFVLPTLGENFGHIFIEALASGCPLITTDRTPWRDLLEKGIGWDLPLERPGDWTEIINRCVQMNEKEYSGMSKRAREYSINWLADPSIETSNYDVLQFALDKRAQPLTAVGK